MLCYVYVMLCHVMDVMLCYVYVMLCHVMDVMLCYVYVMLCHVMDVMLCYVYVMLCHVMDVMLCYGERPIAYIGALLRNSSILKSVDTGIEELITPIINSQHLLSGIYRLPEPMTHKKN